MTISKRGFIAGVAMAAAMAAGLASAEAASGVKVGTLTCDVSGGVGLILGSSKSMRCTFARASGGAEYYSGVINKFGVDIGVTGSQVMVWAVFAAGDIAPGALAGSYGGATAEATAIVGVGANVLVGGSNRSIALQPVSITGQTGLNVAAGVSSLTLSAQ
jgi:hypothetical protein